MVVSVAPLTTTVLNAVPTHQTGVAAEINNAVASVATLLEVAVLGALALGIYNRGLDRNLQGTSVLGGIDTRRKCKRLSSFGRGMLRR
jgi:hypothetical protein